MTKDNYKLLAVAAAGFAAATAYEQGGALLEFTGRPTADQFATIASAIGALFAWFKGRDAKPDNGGAGTLDLLQALKRIIEQFQTKGIPDSVDVTATWGGESYDLKWSKRTKPEPVK